jgi:hypothetical protein
MRSRIPRTGVQLAIVILILISLVVIELMARALLKPAEGSFELPAGLMDQKGEALRVSGAVYDVLKTQTASTRRR